MGYRSDVTIVCEEKLYQELTKIAKEHDISPDSVLYNDKTNVYVMSWAWMKWYEGNDDVDAIMGHMWKYGKDDSDGYGFLYIRIGEDLDDVATFSNSVSLMNKGYVQRECVLVNAGDYQYVA